MENFRFTHWRKLIIRLSLMPAWSQSSRNVGATQMTEDWPGEGKVSVNRLTIGFPL
jgi:hypothetical protein